MRSSGVDIKWYLFGYALTNLIITFTSFSLLSFFMENGSSYWIPTLVISGMLFSANNCYLIFDIACCKKLKLYR